jgi:hypothetical protein
MLFIPLVQISSCATELPTTMIAQIHLETIFAPAFPAGDTAILLDLD